MAEQDLLFFQRSTEDAVSSGWHRAEALKRYGLAAPLANSEGPGFKPCLGRVDLVKLVLLLPFQPRQDIAGERHGCILGEGASRVGLQRGQLLVGAGDSPQEPLTRFVKPLAKLFHRHTSITSAR